MSVYFVCPGIVVFSHLVFDALISGLHELGYDLTHEAKNVYRETHILSVLYHRGRVDSRGYREQ